MARDYSADLVALEVPIGKGPVRLEPVFGMPLPGTRTGPGFIILLVVEGAPLLLENVEIATVQPDPRLRGCDIRDFASNGVSFDACGRQVFFPTANSTAGGNRSWRRARLEISNIREADRIGTAESAT